MSNIPLNAKLITKVSTTALTLITGITLASLTGCQSITKQSMPKQTDNTATQTQETQAKTETQTLWVADKRAECTGVVPMQCLMVQQTTANSQQPNANDWQYLYQEIDGFNWQQGKVSKIKVKVSHLDPKQVPADGSSTSYQLLEVLRSYKILQHNLSRLPQKLKKNSP